MPTLEGNVGLSADSFAAWDEEPTYGAKTGPSAGTSKFSLFLQEDLRGNVQILSAPTVNAFRDINQTYVGQEVVEGSLSLAYAYEGLEHLLLHCFGDINNSASGLSGTWARDFDLNPRGRYQHANSPSLSIHINRGVVGSGVSNPTTFTYEGCVVDEFDISCERGGPVILKITFFGQTETIVTGSLAPTFSPAPIANSTEASCVWGAALIPVTQWRVNVKRGIDKNRFFHSTTLTAEPPMGQYIVTASATTEWDNEARNAGATLRTDYRARSARQLQFGATSRDFITGTVQKYQFTLKMEKALIDAFPPTVPGVGRVLVPITWTAYNDTTTTPQQELRMSQVADNEYTEAL